jgi:hypothetical protein
VLYINIYKQKTGELETTTTTTANYNPQPEKQQIKQQSQQQQKVPKFHNFRKQNFVCFFF